MQDSPQVLPVLAWQAYDNFTLATCLRETSTPPLDTADTSPLMHPRSLPGTDPAGSLTLLSPSAGPSLVPVSDL